MKLKLDKEKTTTFIKSGLLTLSAIILLALGFHYLPNAVYTMKQNNERKLPIYCVDCNDCKVAISFDAAWGNEDTGDILAILKQYDVKATFFMTGGWVETYPDDVAAIAAAGHDLGNHSETHKQMSQLSKSECIAEITKPHDKVKELTGVDMTLFRPPYGDYNNTLLESLEECNYYGIQWDVEVCETNGNIDKSRDYLIFQT
ncbi:MAG: polysaccharide deacetylase family protein [Velocimicrobium sp.]